MDKKQQVELANTLYAKTLHMLDYDLDGITFDEKIDAKYLLNYLTETDDYILQSFTADIFESVKEEYIFYIRTKMLPREKNDAIEVNKLIEWIKNSCTQSN